MAALLKMSIMNPVETAGMDLHTKQIESSQIDWMKTNFMVSPCVFIVGRSGGFSLSAVAQLHTCMSHISLSVWVFCSWEVVQTSSDLPDSELASSPVSGLCAAGSACRLPAVEQRVGPGVPGGPWRSCRHPAGVLWGRSQWRGRQCLWRTRSGTPTHLFESPQIEMLNREDLSLS